ncbi:phenylalanyl-tRNA synthase subunit beta [Pontibacillus halophilus JSM 076056 = DSM 19796]|uniref:Phenylalanine--tRNA ligase beta subunit n=1 Tax=Pontibacillus halophilus JSM 076056 = DSM 19796 TaxID=1385510 RepID=A0A0A5IC45_9BACI|nr:phenylalanine--tRNA ligase subunit beta [Pontibacillus halophilus]KGX93412.1 phenylalanyl-tRNA synthase subunit beta [Pontibacillus halophilus JSM 076056 = DSM 19796]
MFVSLNWLKQYVDLQGVDPEILAERITKTGIEVESVEPFGTPINDLVVGYVKECIQHPNADKLSLTQVDVGDETLQIVCGAPNISQGQHVIVAKPGAVLPGNFKIKKTKLRGEESNGMICSMEELGIDAKYVPEDMQDGIYVFQEDVEVGADVNDLLNLDDVIIELGITPNRADALSMLGVAYEVAAILDTEVQLPEETVPTVDENSSEQVSVVVDAKEANPYYGATLIKDVEVGPSPLWLRNRLTAAGLRPINNVVDITNFVLMEYGQPLHAFDYDRFGSKEVVVRFAKDGETLTTLDDEERTLSSNQLVITNGNQPVALAGVMGGADSEVQDDTTTVLLEAAYFSPIAVREASKDHGLRSDASARFEKGVDPDRVKRAGQRAAQLLAQYANGTVLSGVVEYDELDRSEKSITITTSRMNHVLGSSMNDEDIATILRKLGFGFKQEGETFHVTIPTRRGDISIEEDMVEEIGRIYGYDNLPFTLPEGAANAGGLTKRQSLRRSIRRKLEGMGLSEVITYSLTTSERATQLVSPDVRAADVNPVRLAMPMSEEHSTLRLSLLPEMLASVSYNVARKQQNVAFYETGSVYVSNEQTVTKQPNEQERLSGVLTGTWVTNLWQQEKKQVDFFVVKGILENLFQFLDLSEKITFKQGKVEGMHPGRTALVYYGDEVIGFAGQLHPTVQKNYDLKEAYAFDLDLEKIFDVATQEENYTLIPRYPSITRDIALVVDESVAAGDLHETIYATGQPLVKHVLAFDLYQGEHLEDGKKSLAFTIRYQDPTRTLKDEEVEEAHTRILEAVKSHYQAELRG